MKKKKPLKQLLAILMIILLSGMYLATLLLAIFDPSSSGRLFQASLFLTIALPILLWVYLFLYGFYTKKHTMADLDILKDVDIPAEEKTAAQTEQPVSPPSEK